RELDHPREARHPAGVVLGDGLVRDRDAARGVGQGCRTVRVPVGRVLVVRTPARGAATPEADDDAPPAVLALRVVSVWRGHERLYAG
ncbi:hypothetical protein ACVU7I_07970, partial [Patulibacter sp. S7RM1-6]